MTAPSLDEFDINFDLSDFVNEESVQSVQQKYERLRNNTCWLKSKIIITDFTIQKCQKKGDIDQSKTTHSDDREELKKVCLNYKEATERCLILENENKRLLANQEICNERVIEAENKYSALMSHTNQLQMLVKQLETESDALKVEKELEKSNNKERNKELVLLHKEKEAMLNDILVLKSVILGKIKKRQRHVKLLMKYGKELKSKGLKICKSDESDEDIDNYDNFSLHKPKGFSKVNNHADKEYICSVEQNFIDNCSDSSNGQVSIDTGRGSSRANSHDKYLSSPDYVFVPEIALQKAHKNTITQIDVANSPITVYPPRSVATSPIIFDDPAPMFHDQYDDYPESFDGPEYIIDNVPLFDDINIIGEQTKHVDVCTSPIQDILKFVDTATSPIKNDDYLSFKDFTSISPKTALVNEHSEKESNQHSVILEKQAQRCLCYKVNGKKFVDACTSPVSKLIGLPKFIETGTSTVHDVESVHCAVCFEFKKKTFMEKSTSTEIRTRQNNKLVDVCTSPISKDFVDSKCVGRVTIINQEGELENITTNKKVPCTKNKYVDASTSTVLTPFEQCDLADIEVSEIFEKQNDKFVRKSLLHEEDKRTAIGENTKRKNKKTVCKIQEKNMPYLSEGARLQEKVCLDNNSSKNLHFESTNDLEVQHILNVMKLHEDVISPISKTPSDSHYLKLIPEMNFTLTKIWAAIANIYKMPAGNNELYTSHPTDVSETEEIEEVDVPSSTKTSEPIPNSKLNENVNEHLIGATNESTLDIVSTTGGNTCLDKLNTPINVGSNTSKAKRYKSDMLVNRELSPRQKSEEIILTAETEGKTSPPKVRSCVDSNDICEEDITSNPINMELSNAIGSATQQPIEQKINAPKIKNKSKLERLRNTLLPTCKIKKSHHTIIKYSPKTYKSIPKDKTLTTIVNQKTAYEKAVKVMAELRSNQSKTMPLTQVIANTELGSNSNNTVSTSNDMFAAITTSRSRNKSLSNKDENIRVADILDKSIILEKNERGIVKSTLSCQSQSIPYRELNEVGNEHMIGSTNESIMDKDSISGDNTCLDILNTPINVDSETHKTRTYKSDILANRELSARQTTEEIILTAETEGKLSPPKVRSCVDSNDICEEDITTNPINMDLSNTVLSNTHRPKETKINSSKTQNKATLEGIRKKIQPTCKNNKIDHRIMKQLPTTYTSIPEDKTLSTVEHSRTMPLTHTDTELGCNSSNTVSTSNDTSKAIATTRSRTKRLSNKEENVTVTDSLNKSMTLDQNETGIVKSPLGRRLRKRPADVEIDSLQGSCKRILRSSNVFQHTKRKDLPLIRSNNTLVSLYEGSKVNINECERFMKNVDSRKSSQENNNLNDKNDSGSNLNSRSNCKLLKNKFDHIVSDKSDVTSAKNIRIMKPAIDLSKCLTNKGNAVSITAGNIDYTNNDNNTNNAVSENFEAESDSHVLGDQNNYENGFVFEPNCNKTNNGLMENASSSAQDKNEILMEGKDDCDQSVEDHSAHKNNVISKKHMHLFNFPKPQNQNSNNSSNLDQKANMNKYDILEKNSSKVRTEPSVDVLRTNVANMEQITHTMLNVKTLQKANTGLKIPVVELTPLKNTVKSNYIHNVVNYSDIDLYAVETHDENTIQSKPVVVSRHQKENVLCAALDRYGVISVKYTAKKVPDLITQNISQKIEESIADIISSSKCEQKSKMDNLVTTIQTYIPKNILSGLMKYLKDPTRKNELFNTIVNGAAPPMTRSEMILLYVIEKLNTSWCSDFVNKVWNNIEHALFQLNRAPEFGVIESLSHFYAVLCRYFRNKSRLRCFMLDAMYCLQFKAVPLIRQCLDVWPGVLPYAHENMAKTSLVTCLVYLLHFYKCQDKFNRAQDIRTILFKKYSYRFTEWNETMLLEIFRKAIMDLRGSHNDKKMLRVALIILCKRHGAKWCQLNIIQNMLLPIIEKKDIPERVKHFCVLMLGPLLKPFPADRKAQCEIIINQLLEMLKQNNTKEMNEAIYSSLIFMNKHDQERVVQALLSWNPENVSPEFEVILNDYVMEKPLVVWKKLVTRKPSQSY